MIVCGKVIMESVVLQRCVSSVLVAIDALVVESESVGDSNSRAEASLLNRERTSDGYISIPEGASKLWGRDRSSLFLSMQVSIGRCKF